MNGAFFYRSIYIYSFKGNFVCHLQKEEAIATVRFLMKPALEILDAHKTPLGDLVLRRREIMSLDAQVVYEVKLGEEFLMSSLFTVAEKELARLGLAKLEGDSWDVLVGGLGLGFTAAEVLKNPSVHSLAVVELFPEVIKWHLEGLVPLGYSISLDPRCTIVERDFFKAVLDDKMIIDSNYPNKYFQAVLLDIDHTPRHQLDGKNAEFYTQHGLSLMCEYLDPGGVFGLWSDDPPDQGFVELLRSVFSDIEANVVSFYNPLLDKESTNTVYLGTKT